MKLWHSSRSASAAILVLLLFAAGCEESDPAGPTPVPGTAGSIDLTITGLPPGVPAVVSISGAAGQPRAATASGTVANLPAGAYTVTASSVAAADLTGYAPSPATQTVQVVGGGSAPAAVTYAVSTGALQIRTVGLPAGAVGQVTVTGPGSFQRVASAPVLLRGLPPGTYSVAVSPVAGAGGTYQPLAGSRTATIAAGAIAELELQYAFTPAASVNLDRIVDSVRVAFGLPALAGAVVTTSNPNHARGVAGTRRASGGPPATIDDLWHLGSNFKAFTGTLAAIAVDQGRIGWATTVAQALPEYAATMRSEYRSATLRDLLSHQSGVPRDPPGAVATTGNTRQAQRLAVTDWALRQAPVSTPGSYNYSNTGYMIAAAMVERALNVAFEDAMLTHVFRPLGITDAGWGPQATAGSTQQPVAHRWAVDRWQALENFYNVPVYASAGGAHMSIGSWSRFLQEVLRIEAGTPTIVSLSAGRETTASIAIVGSVDRYGLGWLITSRNWANGRTLTHNGTNTGNHSVTWMSPGRGFAVLAATNSYDGSATDRSARAMDALVGRLITWYNTGQ
jgi:CubicO group peptidase (beta-lactamase class C family)